MRRIFALSKAVFKTPPAESGKVRPPRFKSYKCSRRGQDKAAFINGYGQKRKKY